MLKCKLLAFIFYYCYTTDMKNVLQKNHLKNTTCRTEILRCLSATKKPIAAETIHVKLKKQFDLVTIYRNLNAFEAKGIVFRETINKADCFYLADIPHHHIICRSCDAVACLPCDHKKFTIPHFKNIAHRLVLTGICRQCAQA